MSYVIDTVVITVPIVIVAIAAGASSGGNTSNDMENLLNVVVFFAGWLYFALQESGAHQATIGKRMMGLRVFDMNGQRISFGRASGRYFAKILSALILLIGFVMIAFTARKQGLHDMIAGTVVLFRGE